MFAAVKMTQAFRILFALLMLAAWAHGADKLISIDLNSGTIIVQQQNAVKTIHFNSVTEISLNGNRVAASQLKPGMLLTLGLSDPQNAIKIAASGNPGAGSAVAPPGATPAAAFNGFSTQATRRILIKALVDARDNWTIQDGRLRIEHFEFKVPVNIIINGVKWTPNWNGKHTDDFTGFSPPLAPFAGGNLTVTKTMGRGEVTVLEPPTEANGYKLVFCLQDKGAGAREHEVRITW